MAYTNGFEERVITALTGRVGWKQPAKAGSPVIDAANKTARGNRYFQDFHSIVTIDNVHRTMEEAGANDANLNAHLADLQRAAIMRCLNAVFREPELIEQILLFDRIGQSDQPITNSGLFVGYEINVAPASDVAVQIDSATLLFDQDVTFDLYLFKDGMKGELRSISVPAQAYASTVVDFSELILNYIGSTTKGGRFYLGYFQEDIGEARAIQEQVCGTNKTCMFSAMPFTAKKIADENDFDRNQRSYTMQPGGINLEMSSFKDHTNQIVKKAYLFDEVMGLTVAYMVIEQIIYTCRSNANERVLKDELSKIGIQLDLNGSAPISDSPKIKGLNTRIEEELKRLRKTFFPEPKAQTVNLAGC